MCPQQWQPGFSGPGSFAELVAVPAADLNLVPLPDDLDLVTAASLGCRFATAFRALTAHGRAGRGSRVAVHGCGGVGLSAVMIATALGADVVAVDVSEPALALAGELGAHHLVPGGPDAADHVLLDVAPTGWVVERFDRLVVGSGDGIFEGLVHDIRRRAMRIEVVLERAAGAPAAADAPEIDL